jgi:DMSO/TMAO reductase YedYZ molybdopterin-dependent catalytic subunit
MKKRGTMKTADIVILSVIAAAIFISIIASVFIGKVPRQLQSVEISEYGGKNLSAISEFRDNSIKGPQKIDVDSYNLEIRGMVNNPKSYSYREVLNHDKYSKVVTLNCVEGWSTTILWEGVLVKDLIDEANPINEANTVIFHAYDGYTSSLPLDYVKKNKIILAYKMNNVTLSEERGFPFQLVAESKWGYKWVKWITKIELSDNTEYKGYWERRGYSNEGDLNKSFLA